MHDFNMHSDCSVPQIWPLNWLVWMSILPSFSGTKWLVSEWGLVIWCQSSCDVSWM